MKFDHFGEYRDKYHDLHKKIPIEDTILQKEYENEMKNLILNHIPKKSYSDYEIAVRRTIAYMNIFGYICNEAINDRESEELFKNIVNPLRELTLYLLKRLI